MRHNKVLPIFLFLFILVGCLVLPSNKVQAAVGSEEFSVNVLKVEKTTVTMGEVQDITVEIIDNNNKGFDHGVIEYLPENASKVFFIPLEKTSEKNIYKASLFISKWHAPGQWQPFGITLYRDKVSGQCYNIRDNKEIEVGSFIVSGTTGDYDVPKIKNITVDKKTITSGEVLKVKAEISDYDKSGVSFASIDFESMEVYNYQDGLSYYITIELFPTAEKDIFEGTIVLNDSYKMGEWAVTGAHTLDNIQNYGDFYYAESQDPRLIFPNATFNIIEKNPVFESWKKQNNRWYYFDKNGVKKTGWFLYGEKWYYLGETGMMQTGWIKDGNSWYYLEGTGEMKTGWYCDGKDWYYLGYSGAMQCGWIKYGGNWYYFGDNGIMHTGWVQDGGTWYYLYGNGIMAKNTVVEGCKLGNDGAWIK
ncbi:hypothetical protein [Clostridium sp.]|uniref:hypothetical protein n=1 Tax=Clostridium sp. TaxID=1506 RepID=UPI002FCC979A